MFPQRADINVVTDAAGAATGYTPDPIRGEILAIAYTKDGASPFANGVAVAVTGEESGQAIWSESNVNASAVRAPRQATHGTDGAAALYAAGGTAVLDRIPVAGERLKLVIASGGDTKAGKFTIWWG